MIRPECFLVLALMGAVSLPLPADDEPLVFRSEVSLVRVDVQVLDRDNRAITGLTPQDFILREEGRTQPIRNFGTENLPIDVLLLFDVSASMRPHVERIASAGHEAFRVLGAQDRIGIMVFDRSTRVRLTFRSNPQDVERELERLLKQESFNGGTDITRGLLDGAKYIGREGRRDARKAIVIVTDDQTEMERDEAAVSAALTRADAVLCALIAPDAMPQWTRRRGNGGPWGNGGSWPGGGGGGGVGMGGPLGGIILGRRGGYGGRGGGPGMHGGGTHSAGTAEIARQSGGDSMPVDDAYALENTLSRLRQRYALHFYVPPGVKAGEERTIEVALADTARRRYPDAEVRYRRTYIASVGTSGAADPGTVVTRNSSEPSGSSPAAPQELKRRPAVDGSSGGSTQGPLIAVEPPAQPEKQPPQQASPAPAPSSDKTQAQHGGWRRLKPGEQP